MTNFKEEQELELEALTSIFEEGKEFGQISPTEFVLKLKPDPTDETENHVSLSIHITYTPEYPDTAPEWELQDIVGLPDEKQDDLKGKIDEAIESSLGMAMVYTIAEMCQDFLKENNVKALSMHEEMLKREKEARGDGADEDDAGDDEDEDSDGEDFHEGAGKEEEEWKGLAEKKLCAKEDRATTDSFAAWKVRFDEEMIAAGVLRRTEQKAKTGKMFFLENAPKESGAAEAATADAAGGAGAAGATALVYNAALFGEGEDEDDEDLDDLLDED